jgi:hypothetical protein
MADALQKKAQSDAAVHVPDVPDPAQTSQAKAHSLLPVELLMYTNRKDKRTKGKQLKQQATRTKRASDQTHSSSRSKETKENQTMRCTPDFFVCRKTPCRNANRNANGYSPRKKNSVRPTKAQKRSKSSMTVHPYISLPQSIENR